MGRVKPNHDPLRTVLTPIASAVILLILTGWVGLAHKPEPEVLNGTGVVPAIREALRMIALLQANCIRICCNHWDQRTDLWPWPEGSWS